MNSRVFEISDIMSQESPVFIVGVPRSGTTLLYRLLQHHSSFKPHSCKNESGVSLIESNIFRSPYMKFPEYTPSHKLVRYMLGNEEIYGHFLDSSKWIKRCQNLFIFKILLKKISLKTGNTALRVILYKVSLSHIAIRLFFYYARQARSTRRIIEKTPSHICNLPEIAETFPHAKIIFISRHPVDIYSSFKKREKVSRELGIDTSNLKWLQRSADDFCHDYLKKTRLALEAIGSSDQDSLMMVRYEDIVDDPEPVLRSVCDFLEEDYEERIIPTDKQQRGEWKRNPNLYGSINKKTKNWREFVDETEANLIENRLSDNMRQLNYSRYTEAM